ncbi:YggT family protein [Candidatus Pandoraea novymonadis]|uniref:YggT family protein n=1 Tax=Candidatus Pandoraea novymonadis TaxID=1808959 RepID=A0ABX5FFR2_9BURK|nr:YggT family protein [Candidatus Pandoraea novymonadis]PSB92260.1 hypothetical protein BZL35_00496 [Candidatus Pandoraea novymonadis]
MLVDIFRLILDIVFSLFGGLLIVRAWAQGTDLSSRNLFSHGIFELTNWYVLPLRRFIPVVGRIDWASIIGAWLCAVLYLVLSTIIAGRTPLVAFPNCMAVALVLLLKWFANLVMWLTLLMAILSWLNPRVIAMSLLQHLLDPFLCRIRRLTPLIGGFDLSPMILFLMMQILLMILPRIELFFLMI